MGIVERERARGTGSSFCGEGVRQTVLVVDDEPLMRAVMKRVLLDEGFLVLTAGNADEALAIAGAGDAAIDLVLTDLLMPGMDGVQMVENLRRILPDVPVVFMSAATEAPLLDRLASGPARVVLEKPFEIEALARCVRDTLAANAGLH